MRAGVYWSRELIVPGLTFEPRMMKALQRIARRHMEKQVADPELRAKLTPSYVMGCKRILPSNDWYPALQQPNVELVTDGIREIRPEGIVTADGRLHEVDTIVLATGFKVTDISLAHRIRDANGVSMADSWKGSPQAYLGTSVAGFPNLFFVTGPNTGLGHNSLLFMIEAQLSYVLDALRQMRRRGATRIEVRRDAVEAYNAYIQRRLVRSVWNTGGCSSWYLDATGRNTTIWPYFTWRYWQKTRRFDPAPYVLTNGASPARTGSTVTAPPTAAPVTIDELLAQARSRLERLDPQAASAAMENGAVLVDIRTESQRAADGTVPGALFIPRNVLEWRCDPTSSHPDERIASGRRVVVMCDAGYAVEPRRGDAPRPGRRCDGPGRRLPGLAGGRSAGARRP